MLGLKKPETVTLRRQKAGSRSVQNAVVYEILRDDATLPITLQVQIERRRRRIFSTGGVEEESDGSMLYRVTSKVDLQTNDLVVDSRGNAYKILGFDEQTSLLGTYRRADLRKTRLPAEEDE
jgi:hypothetical protein